MVDNIVEYFRSDRSRNKVDDLHIERAELEAAILCNIAAAALEVL